MTRYEKLIIIAEKQGVEVRELDLGTDKPCGRCLDNIIYINIRISESSKYEILAEEFGHFKTNHGNILNLNSLTNQKQEFKARREGFKLLVKPCDIINAAKNGANNLDEMADYIGISTKTFLEILDDFKKQYGIRLRIDNYYLMLEPNLGIIKDFGGLS